MNPGMYDINRTEFKEEIGIMLGNGEMGGLARNDGLGIDEIWFSDYWRDPACRSSLAGFHLSSPEYNSEQLSQLHYRQSLSLRDGVLLTKSGGGNSCVNGFECEMFLSADNPHLMVIQLSNTSKKSAEWEINFAKNHVSAKFNEKSNLITLVYETKADYMSLPFSRAVWTICSNIPLLSFNGNSASIRLKPGEKLVLLNSIATSFDGADYEAIGRQVSRNREKYDFLKERHVQKWRADWDRFEIEIPQGQYAEVFYRSVYYMFCVTGMNRYLQGECHFSDPAWNMQPFSIGTPSWSAMALAVLNHEERAMKILNNFYMVDALKVNAQHYLTALGKVHPFFGRKSAVEPFCFAHKADMRGIETIYSYGRQRYLDGYMPAVFHNITKLSGIKKTPDGMTYQVLRGCAEFWLRFVYWDEKLKAYMIPPTLGIDEYAFETSSASSVFACAWELEMFSHYTREIGIDEEMGKEAALVAEKLYWPENQERYLDHLNDDEKRSTGSYLCIRSFSLLAFPFYENLKMLDKEKAFRTLDATQQRNRLGEGNFNTMTVNHYALTEAVLGRKDKAYEFSGYSAFRRIDESGVAMGEAYNDMYLYFATGYTSFVLAVLNMMLQSYDDTIYPFPAIPTEWKDVSFKNLRAERGIMVSGEMEKSRIVYVSFSKDGKELLRLNEARPVKIVVSGDNVKLKVIGKD